MRAHNLFKIHTWLLEHFHIKNRDKTKRKYLYVKTKLDISLEREVHYRHMIRPDYIDICKILNLVKDNAYSDTGWWERVEILYHKGFSEEELALITDPEISTKKKKYTYLPQQSIANTRATEGKIAGGRAKYPTGVETVVYVFTF